MFIGQVLGPSYMRNTNIFGTMSKLTPASPNQLLQPRHDRIEIGKPNPKLDKIGIYQPNKCQMRAFAATSYTTIAPDKRLQQELLPPSEQSSYTENDALINQYMKQSRIEGYFDGDTFVQTSSEPVKLFLKKDISNEDLEKFRNDLITNGLGTEIDWHGVENDFNMSMNFDNIERFEQKVDYLASRYVVLKDRIQTQYVGDKQDAELQKLEQLYTKTKENMADSFAKNIGGFFEDLGQSGTAKEMYDSVLSIIDKKSNDYINHLSKNYIYGKITDHDKQWLKQDDGYMAAQLRESLAAVSERTAQTVNDKTPYNEKELVFAGIVAKKFSQQLKNPMWDTFTIGSDDTDLGKHLAEQYNSMVDKIQNGAINEKVSNMLKDSFKPFMENFMDALDTKINQNRDLVSKNPWQNNLIRTNLINRENVYTAFYNSISNR